jgi:tetratricopeptide (TPR) repeat protein
MQLKDAALLRVFAQKLLQLKAEKLAIDVFKAVIDLRPEEPQSYRDYGLALAQMGKYNQAVQQLYKVVKQNYDGRFEGIHLIALNEINHLIAKHPKEIDTKGIPEYFLVQLPMDIRIVLNWDADNTDVDLWVTEPNQEKCMYSYKLTSNGGRISNDFTQGYGPEEYLIRKAPKGTYLIQAHYYGNHRPTLSGKAILTVQLFENYGTPYEVKREITRRLSVVDEELDLATFEFD